MLWEGLLHHHTVLNELLLSPCFQYFLSCNPYYQGQERPDTKQVDVEFQNVQATLELSNGFC